MEDNIFKLRFDEVEGYIYCVDSDEPLRLLKACELCFCDDNYKSEENLKALREMFPCFNSFQFKVFTFLFSEFVETRQRNKHSATELLSLDETKSLEDKKNSLRWLLMNCVLSCYDLTGDFDKYEFTLSSNLIHNITKSGCSKLELQENHELFEFTFPDKIRDEKLFYDNEVFEAVNEIKDYLQADNWNKLQDYFADKLGNLAFTCLLEGPSGTGKTALVRHIAKCTGRVLIFLDMAKIRSSKWGDEEKSARKIFEEYFFTTCQLGTPPILLIDECDTLLAHRQNPDGDINSSLINGINSVVEIFLQELEKFNGILFLTTNNADHMDAAISRRLMFQINIGHPSIETQANLWMNYFPELSKLQAHDIATQTNFTGGQIRKVKEKLLMKEVIYGPAGFDAIRKQCKTNGRIRTNRVKVGFRQ